MGHMTIYLTDDEARAIRKAARLAKRSVSEWAREQMMKRIRSDWPEGYFDLFGALKDDTLRRPPQPNHDADIPRTPL